MHTATLRTSAEVADQAGVSYRQLDYWERCGVIPATRARVGSGHPREWTDWQARIVTVLASYVRVVGTVPTGDLARLARVVDLHETGWAIKDEDGWRWSPTAPDLREPSVHIPIDG